MSNQDVLRAFLEGREARTGLRDIYGRGKGRTLQTDGKKLINYAEQIAYKKDGWLYLNKGKYSVTTSKIQNQLHTLALQYYTEDDIIEYNKPEVKPKRQKVVKEDKCRAYDYLYGHTNRL